MTATVADDVVARPTLLARMGRRQLTLLVAPAGYGKTTLLDAWCDAHGRAVVRLALDADDADARRLWARLGGGDGPVEDALARVLNRLDASGATMLALDNLERLRGGDAEPSFARFVELLPASTRLVAAGREEPALPLARLAAAGRLDVLRADDLRLRPAEVVWLARRVAPAAPSAPQLRELIDGAEGWPAVAYVAARGLGRGSRPARHVAEYLWEEVIEPLDPVDRDFALRTSALESLAPDTCDVLLERRDSAAVLERLRRRGLVRPTGRGYRYHRLLAAVLRDELAAREPALARLLRGRAAELEAQRGSQPDERRARAVSVAAYTTHLYLAGRQQEALAAAEHLGVEDAALAPEPVASCFAVRSLVRGRLGNPADALALARTSVATARTPLGLLALSASGGGESRSLLEEALERAASQPRVETAIRAAVAPPATGRPVDAAELSRAELRVLRLLAGPLTQREIARELYVSPNTVKTHVGAIYRKLGVGSREAAVARSRSLNLIPPG